MESINFFVSCKECGGKKIEVTLMEVDNWNQAVQLECLDCGNKIGVKKN